MRQRWTLFLGLLAGILVGCATGKPVDSISWFNPLRPFQGPTGADVVMLDVALIESPVGDPYLNQELWNGADEQVVALERKAMLEDNGFRVGQVGGIPPPTFKALLTSERTCINPRRIQLHAGNPTPVVLGPVLAQCHFQVHLDGQAVPVSLENTQCVLTVVPTLTPDGQTRLQFTPRIQYGQTTTIRSPKPDRSGWVFEEHRPTEHYPALSWEVTLGLNEYAVVGGRYDHPDTLGQQFFVRPDESVPVQRLLVIRTSRLGSGGNRESGAEEEPGENKAPPLALQAAMTTARASER